MRPLIHPVMFGCHTECSCLRSNIKCSSTNLFFFSCRAVLAKEKLSNKPHLLLTLKMSKIQNLVKFPGYLKIVPKTHEPLGQESPGAANWSRVLTSALIQNHREATLPAPSCTTWGRPRKDVPAGERAHGLLRELKPVFRALWKVSGPGETPG